MDDIQYLQHCRSLWQDFANTLARRTAAMDEENPLRLLAGEFLSVSEGDLYRDGAPLALRLFTHHPEFAPTFPRSLLWFLGGDCLHVMADEEIAIFQSLEEERLAAAERGETFDYATQARSRLLLP